MYLYCLLLVEIFPFMLFLSLLILFGRHFPLQLATQLVQMPMHLALAVASAVVPWWLVGMPNYAGVVLFHILCLFSTFVTANTFATMISTIVPNPMAGWYKFDITMCVSFSVLCVGADKSTSFLSLTHVVVRSLQIDFVSLFTGQTAGSGILSVMFFYCGFFIHVPEIPNYWIWMNYLSLFKYSYESMVVNAFEVHVTTANMDNAQLLTYLGVGGVNRGEGMYC